MPASEQPQSSRSFAVPPTSEPGRPEAAPPPNVGQGAIPARFLVRLRSHVRRFDLGTVLAPGTGFVLAHDPLVVRVPDVAFVSRDRMGRLALHQGDFPGAPDLAVEVMAEANGAAWLEEQAGLYLRAGARQVWQILPQPQWVVVWRSSHGVRLQASDTLDGSALLPGFTCPVSEIFS